MRISLFLVLVASACAPTTAMVNGQRVPRPTLGYTDNRYYAVTHHNAYPEHRGASSGLHAYGGRITGEVCGADVWLESEHSGRWLSITGFIQPTLPFSSAGVINTTRPTHLEVRDRDGERHVIGSIGDQIGELLSPYAARSHTIDFAFSPSSLHGVVGSRRFDLANPVGDDLIGTVTIGGLERQFALRGVSELWSMPPADQATLLPFMLTCEYGTDDVLLLPNETPTPLLTISFATMDHVPYR